MKEIAIRAASGAVFVTLLIGSTLFSELAIGAVIAVAAFIGIQEILTMTDKSSLRCSRTATMGSAVILFTGFAVVLTANDHRYLLPAVGLAVIFPFIHQIFQSDKPDFLKAIISSGIVLYVGLSLILLMQAANLGDYFQPYILLGIFLLTWSYDTFAFLVGSRIGKTKLIERISPKKSLEGVAGGAVAAITAAWIYAQFNTDLSFYHWLVISLIVVIFGTLGDLSESVLKRNFDVKDSGNIMPGHGGILDRFDALLFIGPAVYTYLVFAVH